MAKHTTIGARFLRREADKLARPDEVCTCHVKRESELIRLNSGAVKRKR